MSGLLQANALENQAILDKGLELNLANGGHIVTIQFLINLSMLQVPGLRLVW